MITAITMPALVAISGSYCGVDLKIGAGQIAEQHIEMSVEQVAPASDQVREQRVLVLEQSVMAGVQFVRLGQAKISAQRDRLSPCCRSVAMQLPLTAQADQQVGHQNLENLVPARPLSARRRAISPEPVQLQLAPARTRRPARPPLPQRVQQSADGQRRTQGVVSHRRHSDPRGTALAFAALRTPCRIPRSLDAKRRPATNGSLPYTEPVASPPGHRRDADSRRCSNRRASCRPCAVGSAAEP